MCVCVHAAMRCTHVSTFRGIAGHVYRYTHVCIPSGCLRWAQMPVWAWVCWCEYKGCISASGPCAPGRVRVPVSGCLCVFRYVCGSVSPRVCTGQGAGSGLPVLSRTQMGLHVHIFLSVHQPPHPEVRERLPTSPTILPGAVNTVATPGCWQQAP